MSTIPVNIRSGTWCLDVAVKHEQHSGWSRWRSGTGRAQTLRRSPQHTTWCRTYCYCCRNKLRRPAVADSVRSGSIVCVRFDTRSVDLAIQRDKYALKEYWSLLHVFDNSHCASYMMLVAFEFGVKNVLAAVATSPLRRVLQIDALVMLYMTADA